MIKKVIFGLMTAATLLFYSCGTTKTEPQEALEPPAAVEEEAQTNNEAEQPAEEAQTQDEGNQVQEEGTPANETQNDVSEEAGEDDDYFPPLDDIQEPDITDITIEEIIMQEELKKQQEQQEAEAQTESAIEEPVPEEETVLPVLETPETEDTTAATDEDTKPETADESEQNIDSEADEDSAQEETSEQTVEEEAVIIPSRSVTLKKGETLTVTYPGSGWIYMGSTSEYNNLASRGRKLGSTDTKYTLLAKEAGTQIHHFYKTDNLTGEFIDDYLEVTVLDKKGKSGTIVAAPDYAAAVPKKAETPAKSSVTKNKEKLEKEQKELEQAQAQAKEQEPAPETKKVEPETTSESKPASVKAKPAEQKPSETKSKQSSKKAVKPEPKQEEEEDVIVIEDEETVVVVEEQEEKEEKETADLTELLNEAVSAKAAKNYNLAYKSLLNYLEQSTDDRDEALFLLGQLLEEDTPIKNIKEAINTYQTLCDNYPASKYWDKANKRIIYLKRFYIDIH